MKKSLFSTVRLQCQSKVCDSLEELRTFIASSVPDSLDIVPSLDAGSELGYLEPGHGSKGKRCWLHTDADLVDMYKQHKHKKEILLWCYTGVPESQKTAPGHKRSHASVYDSHTRKMSEVDEIVSKLDEKHQGRYTPEQQRAWAHMIHLSKHSSYEDPPDKPFFRGVKRHGSPLPVPQPKKPPAALSPGRKVNLRSELIEQLQKWHNLRDIGAISPVEYEDLQQRILADIKAL